MKAKEKIIQKFIPPHFYALNCENKPADIKASQVLLL